MIDRGYQRRSIDIWSATRWSTHHIMLSLVGPGLKEKGIHSPKDLLPLPWDEDTDFAPPTEPYTEEDVESMQNEIDRANEIGLNW